MGSRSGASGTDDVPPGDEDDATRSSSDEPAKEDPPTKSRVRRVFVAVGQIAFTLLLAVTLVLAWPAPWGGRFAFGVVSGTSMLPQLEPGDLVLALRNPDNEYQIGDTILYHVDYQGTVGRIVHKIVGKNPDGTYITQGVNKRAPDIWPVVPSNVQGRVFASFSNGQKIIDVIKSPNFIPLTFGLYLVWMFWPRRKKTELAADGDDPDDKTAPDDESTDPDAAESSQDS